MQSIPRLKLCSNLSSGSRTTITFLEAYSFSTPCGYFASGNRKICSQGLRVLHASAPRLLPGAKRKIPYGIFDFAPGVGLEPTTNALHLSLSFPKGMDYIITPRGARRFGLTAYSPKG